MSPDLLLIGIGTVMIFITLWATDSPMLTGYIAVAMCSPLSVFDWLLHWLGDFSVNPAAPQKGVYFLQKLRYTFLNPLLPKIID